MVRRKNDGRIAGPAGANCSGRRDFLRVGTGVVAVGVTAFWLRGWGFALEAEEAVMTGDNSSSTNDRGIVTIKSPLSFQQTVERLKSAFESHGIKVFAVIDQQAEARAVDLNMPPMVLILFGNPKAGTPLMVAQPLSGLDLPLKVLVSEANAGEVLVSFNSTQYILKRHALPEQFGSNIDPAARLIENALRD